MHPIVAQKIAAAEQPATVDTRGVCDIVEAVEGRRPAEETVRRWPLKYKLIGRTRIYEADHVIEFARARCRNAPLRVAAAARSRQPA
jgi:hypothetical protein